MTCLLSPLIIHHSPPQLLTPATNASQSAIAIPNRKNKKCRRPASETFYQEHAADAFEYIYLDQKQKQQIEIFSEFILAASHM
jgi:hypothetical protein